MLCLDSTFIIDYLRGDPLSLKKAAEIKAAGLATTSVNCFEVLSGLIGNGRVPRDSVEVFSAFISSIEVFEVDYRASFESARIFAGLAAKGRKVEGSDCLVAGTMLSHGCSSILTRNKKHFERIPGLKVESY